MIKTWICPAAECDGISDQHPAKIGSGIDLYEFRTLSFRAQVSAEHPIENIEGVQFLHGVSGGAATSHWLSTDLYRAFHNKRCFEVAINQTGTEPHVTDPPMKTLTAAQQKKLDRTKLRPF
jgi:hypothetical protein